MRFKKPFTRLETGWMAPSGEFYPVEYMGHLHTADEIYIQLHGEPVPFDVEERLVKEGWVKILMLPIEFEYLFYFDDHLSQEQKRVIRPVFENERERICDSSVDDLEEEFYG